MDGVFANFFLMAPPRKPDPEELELLRATVADPFMWEEAYEEPVYKWFQVLRTKYPLMCLDAKTYLYRQDHPLPTTHPLGMFVASIMDDEGLESHGRLSRLQGNLDGRRLGDPVFLCAPELWSPPYLPAHSGCELYRMDNPLPLIVEYDDEGEGYPQGVYDDVGLELVVRVNAQLAAPTAKAQDQADKELKRYLKELKLTRGKGRPAKALSRPLLRALHREASRLINLAQNAAGTVPSDRTRQLLEENGVGDADLQDEWSLRLTFPPFSAVELSGIRDAMLERPRPLTPTMLAFCLIARRMNVKSSDVAKRMGRGSEAERLDYIRYGPFAR